ncbi:MAG: glycosyltransferase [Proteobacteria bacterium]|nr:glycosyltransferase [Pseudomonadota bacterium]
MTATPIQLSALVVAHNEEKRIVACLQRLKFADQLVVVLDKCTDKTKELIKPFNPKVIEGSWEIEGDRRNTGLAACDGEWILEIDADEHVPPELAKEIRRVISTSTADRHLVPIGNIIGKRLVKYGWGASFGTSARPGLFRKGTKVWGRQRLHPSLTWTGTEGAPLTHLLLHYVDDDVDDMLKRLLSYSRARSEDLLESGDIGSLGNNIRRFFSRFFKCYVARKGYKEGALGFLIALCAGLYPLLSYLRARIRLEATPKK